MIGRRAAIAAVCAAVAAFSAVASSAPDSRIPDILVSRQLLESQHLQVGDVVSLSSDSSGSSPQSFRITGQYEPTPDPMRLGAARLEVRMHLQTWPA